jgi:hypothetical protein
MPNGQDLSRAADHLQFGLPQVKMITSRLIEKASQQPSVQDGKVK